MRVNKIKQKLAADRMVIALMMQFVHPGLGEFLGHLGFDCMVVDGEHGPVNETDCENFLRACDLAGAFPLMRIPYDAALIQRYLDMGFYGFHFVHIESAEQARACVDAVKFRPHGHRGTGLTRTTNYGLSMSTWEDYAADANAQTFIKISIEDLKGLAAVPEICAIPGIDVVTFGTGDLADAMGIPGQRTHPRLIAEVDKAFAIIRAAGKQSGIPTFDGQDMAAAHERGARFMTLMVTQVIAQGAAAWNVGPRALTRKA